MSRPPALDRLGVMSHLAAVKAHSRRILCSTSTVFIWCSTRWMETRLAIAGGLATAITHRPGSRSRRSEHRERRAGSWRGIVEIPALPRRSDDENVSRALQAVSSRYAGSPRLGWIGRVGSQGLPGVVVLPDGLPEGLCHGILPAGTSSGESAARGDLRAADRSLDTCGVRCADHRPQAFNAPLNNKCPAQQQKGDP